MELSASVRSALIDPRRGAEVQGWLRGDPSRHELARQWRGADGETMMHWAFLSSWMLALDLYSAGLDYHAHDQHGRTPMDWLSDRLWGAVVEPVGSARLSLSGQERLRKQTEEQVQGLWSLGIRPTNRARALHVGVVWMRAGAWSLLPLLKDEVLPQLLAPGISTPRPYQGPCPGWMRWTPRQGHALHAWVLSPDTPGRRAFLEQWQSCGLDVDARDEDGRTPLWYAVEAALFKPQLRSQMAKVIRQLVEAGADPHAEDIDTTSPLSLLLREKDAWTLHTDLLNALGVPSQAQEEEFDLDDDQDDQDGVSSSVHPLNPPRIDRALPVPDED